MNIYQKVAIGGFIMWVVALSVTKFYGVTGLVILTAFALIVVLLVFPTVWKLIFSIIEMIGLLIGGIGHGIGMIGDVVADWSEDRRHNLGSSQRSNVPSWDSLEREDGYTIEDSDDLDVPSFVKDAMEHQNQ